MTVSPTGTLSIAKRVREIGRAGEKEATQLTVDVSGWDQAFENAVYSILVRLPDQSMWPILAGAIPVDGKLVVVLPREVFASPGKIGLEVRAE